MAIYNNNNNNNNFLTLVNIIKQIQRIFEHTVQMFYFKKVIPSNK